MMNMLSCYAERGPSILGCGVDVGGSIKKEFHTLYMTLLRSGLQWGPSILGSCIYVGRTIKKQPHTLHVTLKTRCGVGPIQSWGPLQCGVGPIQSWLLHGR